MAMKYKVGDKVTLTESTATIDEIIIGSAGRDLYRVNITNTSLKFNVFEEELKPYKESIPTHEDTILHLNELNTAKSRQIERLVKYIALDFQIDVEGEREQVREDLLKHIKDEDLVNMIMFHVRKGK